VAGTLLSTSVTKGYCGPKKLNGWDNNEAVPNSAGIAVNKTGSEIACTDNGTVRFPADTINMDPESNSNVSVQWTAPKAGAVTITGSFQGDDTSEVSHAVDILHNATSIYSNTISSFGQVDTFSVAATVSKGDTISFENDTNGFHNLSTGLQVTIAE
jgi:hypothetical protein